MLSVRLTSGIGGARVVVDIVRFALRRELDLPIRGQAQLKFRLEALVRAPCPRQLRDLRRVGRRNEPPGGGAHEVVAHRQPFWCPGKDSRLSFVGAELLSLAAGSQPTIHMSGLWSSHYYTHHAVLLGLIQQPKVFLQIYW